MFNIKKLNGLVNSPDIYPAFVEYVEGEIAKLHKSSESLTEPIQIYRAQGEIARLRKMLRLREEVNGRKS